MAAGVCATKARSHTLPTHTSCCTRAWTSQPGRRCLDYGSAYWNDLGVDPNADNALIQNVLGAAPSTRRAILDALLRQRGGNLALVTLQDRGEEDYLKMMREAEDPAAAFDEHVGLIRLVSGRELTFSTGVAVGDAGIE